MAIDWRQVLIAFVVSIAALVAVEFVWAFISVPAFFIAEDYYLAFLESPLYGVMRSVFGWTPIVLGSAYLAYAVKRRPYVHAAIYGGIHVLMWIPIFPGDPPVMTDLVYCVAQLPVALATCWGTRQLERRTRLCCLVAHPVADSPSLNPYRPPTSIPDADSRLVDAPGETGPLLNRLPAKLEYVNGAVEMAMSELATGIHVSATKVCRMAVQTAFDLNDSDAPLMLDDLGLSRSEDIGAAIDELIAIGVLQPDENDSTDEFAGLYDTSTPPSSWVVRWEADTTEDGG